MSIALAHLSLDRRVGHILFLSVGMLGLAIVVFALSNWLVLSMAALAVYGAGDAISVVIRHSLIQTRTPSEMLGRVAAVNSMCTGTSSTLGEFESGLIAAWFGVVASALVGGFGAILITLLWWRLFPQIARIDNFASEH
jgi:MFS family permease